VIARLLTALALLFIASPSAHGQAAASEALRGDLDRLFDDAVLARAVVAARVDSLGPRGSASGVSRVIYSRNADQLVVPASNLKILTVAVAADDLGWDFRYETRLETTGIAVDGTLTGDLVIVGSGDPSIGSPDGGHAALFLEWAEALRRAGIHRVNGRIVADDNALEDAGLGAGWAWDNLAAGYSAPVGALNFNENAVVARIAAGSSTGANALVEFGPMGHGLALRNAVVTGAPGSPIELEFQRRPNTVDLTLRGSVPSGSAPVTRTAAIDNPTLFFAEAFRLTLAFRGIPVSGGAWDIDGLDAPPDASGRMTIAIHRSPPLSVLAGHAMKVSQNMYAEAFLKTLGRRSGAAGTASSGLTRMRDRVASWGVGSDEVVLYDGSGLSRYNYVTVSALVNVLSHVWRDERLRGPFVAGLPVAGEAGSLDLRMRGTPLARNVQAKTGTLNHVRALSGYLERRNGEKLVFSIVVNHYTAPSAAIDGIVEKTLERLLED
jgi:D-alanyl-D-alanine carboxypeptidase/D-alanyl-D-alanine-endopeptidase (penicillin-binding protein 4)